MNTCTLLPTLPVQKRFRPFLAKLVLGAAPLLAARTVSDRSTHLTAGADLVLVCVDRTLSVDYAKSPGHQQHLRDVLQAVRQRVNLPGDRLGLIEIQHTTDHAARQLKLCTSLPDDYQDMGGPSKALADAQFKRRLGQERDPLLKAIREAATTPNPYGTGHESDLWGTLQAVNTFFASARSDDRCVVYYLSDMVESKTGAGRCDYQKQPLTTPSAAAQHAKADLQQVRAVVGELRPVVFAHLNAVHLLFPQSGSVFTQNNGQIYYWQTIFEALGAQKGVVQAD